MKIELLIKRLNRNFETKMSRQFLNTTNFLTLHNTRLNVNELEPYMRARQLSNRFTKIPLCNNEFYKMYLIRWGVNEKLTKHYHPNRSCIFKVIDGELKETRNDIDVRFLKEKEVSYIDDTIGAHEVENNNDDYTYSLHIYYE